MSNVRRSLTATSNTVASVRVGQRVYLSDALCLRATIDNWKKPPTAMCMSEGYLYLPNSSMEVLLPIYSAEETL
jgi:hypothetical protein